jgi:5-methylcytosine-specific restriction endonuclease McrBC regulatory subunit McrC
MPFTSSINSTPFWAILFDMDYLFEKFCAYLFRKSDIVIKEQNMIDCFYNENRNSNVRIKPDFVLYKDKEIVNVVDAKWKLLDNKNLYGLAAQNFWQLFSYMNLVSDKEINGYFIVPKNTSNIDDEVVFLPQKEGKSITILSIDFSLDFEELIEKYKFEINDNALKIKNIEVEKVEEIAENNFDTKQIDFLDFNGLIEELSFN